MPLISMHNHPLAKTLCDCTKHTETRQAGVKAGEIAREIVAAEAAGDHQKATDLLPELERLNAIANQEIK